jgi:RNA polymerase sigma factor (sigma-70 family)
MVNLSVAHLANFDFDIDDYPYDKEIFKENPLKHLGLVGDIAKDFIGCDIEYEDLISYGVAGLVDACQRYDKKYGCKFSTYGTYYILNSMIKALVAFGRPIRVPDYLYKIQNKINAGKIVDEDLPETTRGCLEAARLIWGKMFHNITPMKCGDNVDGSFYISEAFPDNSQKEDRDLEELQELVRYGFVHLNPRERRVLYLSFYESYSDYKISFITGIKIAEVRSAKQDALSKMRDHMEKTGMT